MASNSSLARLSSDGKPILAPRKSLAEDAADTLRELILIEKLEPGTAVPERELAEALGVSRTPLREALRILEHEGLVEYSSTRRPFVANPSIEEIADFINVLGALEALGGEETCKNATDKEIKKIVELQQKMEKNSGTGDSLAFFKIDMKFHCAIVAASRNDPLIETHRQYNARVWRSRYISSRLEMRRDLTLKQHADIVDALLKRDGKKMAKAMRDHLATSVQNIAEVIKAKYQS